MELFRGLDGVHGTHGVPVREGLKWGIKTTAKTLREPVTVELWEQHLAGRRPLGVVPIMANGLCVWASIDIDLYDTNLLDIIERVERARLPLVPCMSKSGGLHLFLFLSKPAPAATIQVALRAMVDHLGLDPATEIFPKQTYIDAERDDAGNWIIVPYFGGAFDGKLREQVGLKKTGAAMLVGEFLSAAEAARTTGAKVATLVRKLEPAEAAPFGDGPPCLQAAVAGGAKVGKGQRNDVLFDMGVYAMKKHPEEWQTKLDEYNRAYMDPPQNDDEVRSTIRSLEKRDYSYKCKCTGPDSDRAVCCARPFGAGRGPHMPVFDRVTVTGSGKDAVWTFEVDGRKVTMTPREFGRQETFNERWFEEVHYRFHVLRQNEWIDFTNAVAASAVAEAAAGDATPDAHFTDMLEDFLVNRARGHRREDILAGRPFEDESEHRHYFRLKDFMAFLRMAKSALADEGRIKLGKRIDDKGGGKHETTIRGRSVDLRWVPSSAVQETPELEVPALRQDPLDAAADQVIKGRLH